MFFCVLGVSFFVVWYDISINQGKEKIMTVLVDNSKAVEITIREWDEVGM